MPDKAWKAFERRLAARFGGRRRGPDTADGKSDIVVEGWAPEAKLLARPGYADLLNAARQAERNALNGEIPVAIIKRKGDLDNNALVVMRLETFSEWFINFPEVSDEAILPDLS